MTLVPCPACRQQVSSQAASCPKCGHPIAGPPPVRISWGFEWRSKAEVMGLPLVHVAVGRDGRTGRFRIAKGIVAIGQFGIGLITIAQFGVGLVFGFGQLVIGWLAIGQLAIALQFGVGQAAVGKTAIGQAAAGRYVLCQVGEGKFVWSPKRKDPEAVEYFTGMWQRIKDRSPWRDHSSSRKGRGVERSQESDDSPPSGP